MKRLSSIAVLIMLFVCGSTTSSMAALTVQTVGSQTVVYDDVTNWYWYQDLTAFVNQTYSEVLTTITNLRQGGLQWELATREEAYDLVNRYQGAQIGDSFTLTDMYYQEVTGNDGDPLRYDLYESHLGRTSTITVDEMATKRAVVHQTARYVPPYIPRESCLYSVEISYATYEVNDTDRYEKIGAWVVSKTGPTTVPESVPEPASLMLLVSGLTSLFAMRKKVRQ